MEAAITDVDRGRASGPELTVQGMDLSSPTLSPSEGEGDPAPAATQETRPLL